MMPEVVQAFDRAPIAEMGTDDAAALERELQAADRAFRDRDGWLKPHQRIAVLRRLAALMEGRREHLGLQIAREGGKPLPDAIVETTRAVDGVHIAADELRNFAGREIPMGLSAAAGAHRRRRGDLCLQPSAQPDRPSGGAGRGAGAVHHAAFRVPDPAALAAWHVRMRGFRVPNSGEVERFYFRSLYSRAPSGDLFKLATFGPGFDADEPRETMGEALSPPPFLEPRRAAIAAGLKPLDRHPAPPRYFRRRGTSRAS